MNEREVAEGQQKQGVDEEITYTITTTKWGSNPTAVSMVVKDRTNAHEDVTDQVTTGSISVSGDVITLKTIKSLELDHRYRSEIKFSSGGHVFECYFYIKAEE